MEHLQYWNRGTNPETGKKFEQFYGYLKSSHNTKMDVDAMLRSPYGAEFTRRLEIRFRFEDDAMGQGALDYYRELGLRKELFDGENYYSRWSLFTPLEPQNEKLPLVISLHGGGSSIEVDEFSTGYPQIAAREGFMVAFPQDPNWQNVQRLIEKISAMYPVDPERIYISGFSQGGRYTHTAYMRIPHLLAAAAPCGNDVFCPWDGQNIFYTEEEYAHFRKYAVPILQIHGAYDASSFLPLNLWVPRTDWKELAVSPDTDYKPQKSHRDDPAWIHEESRGYSDPAHLRMKENPGWWRPYPNCAPEGSDTTAWQVEQFNRLLELLNCKAVDAEVCRTYLEAPETSLHHILGVYGDREYTQNLLGVEHHVAEYLNSQGRMALRLMGIANWSHWQSPLMAELCWAFFKKFRRDARTGQVIEE